VKIDPDDLPQAPNLYYVGMKTYEELPAYLSRFDLAMVPFALSEATRFLSPTKTLEYMAAHKPIVSTPINDVVELYGEVVHIAHNPEEFVAQAEAALAEDKSYRLETETRLLEQNTWDSIAARMDALIENALEEQIQHSSSNTRTVPKNEAA
jgi:UDP-galactopyranose mutase